MSKIKILIELWEFLAHNKRYWLAPIILILVLFGLFIVLMESSTVAPFIYAIF